VTPDLITMAKALTNGAQPMGAVAVAQEIHDAIVERGPRHQVEFFHGYTYSAHPAACAAGLATLSIYQHEKVFERAHELTPYFLDRLFALRDLPALVDIRGYGLLAGVELAPRPGQPGLAGYEAQRRLLHAGLHLKATGDTLLVAPPYVAERTHVDELVSIVRAVLSER
jgi:beta-alanine--pyruvate transaminase